MKLIIPVVAICFSALLGCSNESDVINSDSDLSCIKEHVVSQYAKPTVSVSISRYAIRLENDMPLKSTVFYQLYDSTGAALAPAKMVVKEVEGNLLDLPIPLLPAGNYSYSITASNAPSYIGKTKLESNFSINP